ICLVCGGRRRGRQHRFLELSPPRPPPRRVSTTARVSHSPRQRGFLSPSLARRAATTPLSWSQTMPPSDPPLTDPSPAPAEQALRDAVKTATGKARVGLLKADPADYQRFLKNEFAAPEGVMMWLSDKGRVGAYPPTPRGTLLGVVWRTTPLGRTV